MRHPSLLDFLIEAAKTFRTRRKKALMVDQSSNHSSPVVPHAGWGL
jgi:hypothetical protein